MAIALVKGPEPVRGDKFADWLTRKLRDEAKALTDDADVEPEFHDPTKANP